MKALTICQPWAELAIENFKSIEVRNSDRFLKRLVGETFAIHAAKRVDWAGWLRVRRDAAPLVRIFMQDFIREKQRTIQGLIFEFALERTHKARIMPTGVVLGTAFGAELIELPDDPCDYEALCPTKAGQFGLRLQDVTKFAMPIAARGYQGVWNWEPEGAGE